jgi:hypothetical protein
MTPEQARELNRIAVKAEALQDNFTDQGFKGLKITGQMDPTYIYNKRQGDSTFVFLNNGDPRATPTTTATSAWPCSTSRRKPKAAPSGS